MTLPFFKRLISLLFIVLGAVLVVHTLVYMIPGDPALLIAGEYANPDDIEKIRMELSLNDSYWTRYIIYVKRFCQLDFGTSIYSGLPVTQIIAERFPATLALASIAMIIASFLGIALGILSAYFKDTWCDRTILSLSSLTISTPIFVTCILLSLVFSYYFRILPPSGKQGLNPMYIILPSIALASRSIALIVRVVRNEMILILNQNYIKTARAVGFSESRIVLVFALKNILVPVLVVILLDFGAYLGGAVVTESVFSWPGIGRTLIVSLYKRDIPLMQGIILFGTLLFIFIGLLIDIVQNMIDRRIVDS